MDAGVGIWTVVLASTVLAGCTVEGCGSRELPATPDGRQRDAFGTLTDSDGVDGLCSPTKQIGCNAGEKCTWIRDQDDPPIGHVGCTPDGTLDVGDVCSEPVGGPSGYDACKKGEFCTGGRCEQLCDNDGGIPNCDSDHTCVVHAGVFENSGVTIAGVCTGGCDPLTQEKRGTSPTACGSPIPEAPDSGCYGYDTFKCMPNTAGTSLTDRTVPISNAGFTLGCSPGFLPAFYESSGSTRVLCSGFCAALETDNTAAHVNNGKGDPNALAKLPAKSAAASGDGTCDAGKKGSEASSQCHFIWPFLTDDTGALPAGFGSGPLRDTLGLCFAFAHFQIDTDGDGNDDAPYPDCATLPPYSAATPGIFDDASDFSCQLFAHTPATPQTAARRRGFANVRLGTGAAALARHDLR